MTQFIFVVQLKSQAEIETTKALSIVRKTYKENGKHKLQRIMLDNAAAFTTESFQAHIRKQGLQCVFCTPGLHVRIAEASNKQIKALVRTTVLEAGTNKLFRTPFVPLLVPWVVDSINFTLRSGHDSQSPYTRFTGKLVDLETHFPAAFLDIVAVDELTEPHKLNNLDPRAKIGFIVARDTAHRGVVTVLDFQTGSFIKRKQMTILTGEFYVNKAKEFLKSGLYKKGVIHKEFALGNLDKYNEASEFYDISKENARIMEDDVVNSRFSEEDELLPPSSTNESADIETAPIVVATTVVETGEYNQLSKNIRIQQDEMFKVYTERDGACLFYSIEYYFKQNTGHSALELRALVSDYILYNQLEEIEGMSIRAIIILNSRDLVEGTDDRTDSEHFEDYVHTLQGQFGWAEELEVELLAQILGIQIMIFEEEEKGFGLRAIYGRRSDMTAPKVVILHFDGEHYEPINITNKASVDRILKKADLDRLGGDTILDSTFIYSSLTRFSDYESYSKSLRCESSAQNNSDLRFDPKTGFNFNQRHTEELLDDRKLTNMFCMLTLGESDNTNLGGETDTNTILKDLKSGPSEGAQSLRTRRPKEVARAVRDEISQMHDKQVWEYISPDDLKNRGTLKNKRPIPVIMLEKEKHDSQGKFMKVKARAVALGNLQATMEVWSKEAPTAAMQSFYIVIFLAAKYNIVLESFDVTGAFLNASLPEDETEVIILSKKHADIAIELRPELYGLRRKDGTLLAILKMCLYGLQQSPRKWFLRIRAILKQLGLKSSEHDSCLYYVKINGKVNYLILFVDDMLVAFQDKDLRDKLYELLVSEFGDISSQSGEVISFLGITIRQNKDHISLDQEGFITKLKDSLKLNKVPIYSNPVRSDFNMCQDRFLRKQVEADPARLKKMRQLAMAVMYCALRTRRDVQFITSFLASITCPEKEDIDAITRVIVYLYNTIGKRQFFYRAGKIILALWCDASHNLFADARGQQCIQVYGDATSAALDMSSNKGKQVTNSSYEEELLTLNLGVDKGIMTSLIFTELGVQHELPMSIYSDNEAAVLTANQEHINKMGRSKFMNRKLFYIYDKVQDKWVKPTHVQSKENSADIGTKNLFGSHYDYLANRQFTRMHGKTAYGTEPAITGGGYISDININSNEKFISETLKSTKLIPKLPINKVSTVDKTDESKSNNKSKTDGVTSKPKTASPAKIGGGTSIIGKR